MNTPKIRFKGFTDDWEQRKLGDVLKERTERAKGEEELLSVTIANGVIRQADSEKRNIASEDKRNYKVVKKGDIPYNSMRMWQGAVGNSQYDGIVSPAYTILVPTDEANDKFFMELFKKENSLQRFKRWSQGLTSDTWNLKYPALSTMQFFIPSIKEQKRIANCLQELDYLITLHQRKCDETKQLKKFMLQKMFPKNGEKNPKIRFEGFTDDWEQRKVGDQMYIKSRIGWQALTKQEYLSEGDYYLITGTDIDETTHRVDLKRSYYVSKERYEMDSKIQVKEGDIIVTKDGTIGKVAMVTGLDKPATLNSHLFVLRDMSGKLDNHFLLHILNSHMFNHFVKSTKTGSTLTGLPQKTFVEFAFSCPKYEEQKLLSNYFDRLDHLIALHQRKCEKLKALKKFMLQNMFI